MGSKGTLEDNRTDYAIMEMKRIMSYGKQGFRPPAAAKGLKSAMLKKPCCLEVYNPVTAQVFKIWPEKFITKCYWVPNSDLEPNESKRESMMVKLDDT